jgi:hypothetical protein
MDRKFSNKNGEESSKRIPHVRLLGPIFLVLCINDMPDYVKGRTYLFCG